MKFAERVRDHLPYMTTTSGVAARVLSALTLLVGLTVPFASATESAPGGTRGVPESTLVTPLLEASSSASQTTSAEGTPPAPAPTQTQAPLLARPSAEEGKVRELLRLTGSVNVGFQMRDKILDTFKRAMPQVPAEVWSGFSAECDPRELEDAIVPLYLASFTAAELDAMLVFYHSPVGEKLLRKQPEIFRASSEAGRQWAADITYRLRARLTEKGYPPPGAPGTPGARP